MESDEKSPFLTIVTRCHRATEILTVNVGSVDAQTDQDMEHILLWDPIKSSSVERANKNLGKFKDLISGEWVYVLDDDDQLIYPTFVEELRKIVDQFNPSVVMVKAVISELHQRLLPEPWGSGPPVFCRVSSLNFIVRADIWKKHIHHFGTPTAGDYNFINKVWESERFKFYWWDKLVAYAPRTGRDKEFK